MADFNMWIEWSGWSEVREAIRQAKAEVMAAVVRAMAENVEDLLGRAIQQAPVDEGTLRGSGSARVVSSGGQVKGEVGFNTPYAARQHECTEYKHPQGGKAKYLEDPLKENTGRYVQNIVSAVGSALSGGSGSSGVAISDVSIPGISSNPFSDTGLNAIEAWAKSLVKGGIWELTRTFLPF